MNDLSESRSLVALREALTRPGKWLAKLSLKHFLFCHGNWPEGGEEGSAAGRVVFSRKDQKGEKPFRRVAGRGDGGLRVPPPFWLKEGKFSAEMAFALGKVSSPS